MANHPIKRFCFTLNNYTPEEEATLMQWIQSKDPGFVVVGREVAPETGTRHLQGFMNLKKKMWFDAIKRNIPRAHIERARGTDEENEKYCSKGGDLLLRMGEPSKQGKRSDLSAAVDTLNNGSTMREVARAFPCTFVRYGRGLRDYVIQTDQSPQRDWKTEVHVIVGVPGCGKSRYCHDLPGEKFWKPRSKWWDGYNGQEIVILDDFYGWLPFDEMLRIMDCYPYRVETKGGTLEFVAKKIYVTSNKPVEEWYDPKYTLRALFRRITTYQMMKEDGTMLMGLP